MTLPTLAITIDHHPEAYDAAVMMQARGIVGTFFPSPTKIVDRPKPGHFLQDYLFRMKMWGFEIGAYSEKNMTTFYAANGRKLTNEWLMYIRSVMYKWGCPVVSLAPNSRDWSVPLAGLAAQHFENVRVADLTSYEAYPIVDRMFVRGGSFASLHNGQTVTDLTNKLDNLIATGGLLPIVVHRVSDDGAQVGLTINKTKFAGFLDAVKTRMNEGTLRVRTFARAMEA